MIRLVVESSQRQTCLRFESFKCLTIACALDANRNVTGSDVLCHGAMPEHECDMSCDSILTFPPDPLFAFRCVCATISKIGIARGVAVVLLVGTCMMMTKCERRPMHSCLYFGATSCSVLDMLCRLAFSFQACEYANQMAKPRYAHTHDAMLIAVG